MNPFHQLRGGIDQEDGYFSQQQLKLQYQQQQLKLQYQQQQQNNFLQTNSSTGSQEQSLAGSLPRLESIVDRDLRLMATIDRRTVLRGLVREYIDARRGILEIYQVGHAGLLSEPVAGNFVFIMAENPGGG